MATCASCGREFDTPEGMIDDDRYCHSGESPTCYERAQMDQMMRDCPLGMIYMIRPGVPLPKNWMDRWLDDRRSTAAAAAPPQHDSGVERG